MNFLQICVNLLLIFFQLNKVKGDLDYRLNNNLQPIAYDIQIRPFLKPTDGARQFSFDAACRIVLKSLKNDLRHITLHSQLLEILNARLYDENGDLIENFDANQLQFEQKTNKLTLQLKRTTLNRNGNYSLRFVYKGQIQNGMTGFFRVNYTQGNETQSWLGITQMQRINARTVFPCFDEPKFKAKFRIHIQRTQTQKSFFNTRLLYTTESESDDTLIDHFEETPIMSTYLVGFIVGDFVACKNGYQNISIIVTPTNCNKTLYSHEVSSKALHAYEQYTDLSYKELGNDILQNAASPVFPHNGMENWGLIVYKEAVLVHEPTYTDGWMHKEYTARIMTHEIAHMWFGNSVTFAWWSYFWLNEAFARYFEYFMTHQLYPEYQLDQQFIFNQLQMIFAIDAVNTTQPLTSQEADIQTPNEIAYKFSSITYAKGATIIRMFRNLMGHQSFDAAIKSYLKANHLGNTIPADLFMHLKKYWPKTQEVDLNEFFFDWTAQIGFPVVMITFSKNRRQIIFKQKRFLLNADNNEDINDQNLRYTIPITFTTNIDKNFSNLEPNFYFNKTTDYVALEFKNSINWIILNLQQSNYYRVLYDRTTYENLFVALKESQHSGIDVANRAQIIDDALNFGQIGMVTYDDVFKFLEYLKEEVDYLPWSSALKGLQLISQRLQLEQQENFGKFILQNTEKVYKYLNKFERITQLQHKNFKIVDIYMFSKVISWRCKYNDNECHEKSQNLLKEALQNRTKLTPDTRAAIYCNGMRNAAYEVYENLRKFYFTESVNSEREMIIGALACTRQFISMQIDLILTNDVPIEHKRLGLTPLYTQNYENITHVFELLTAQIDDLAKALGGWTVTANVLADVAQYFTSTAQQNMFDNFIKEHGQKFDKSIKILEKAVNDIEKNLEWSEQHLRELNEYLKQRNVGSLKNLSFMMFITTVLICNLF